MTLFWTMAASATLWFAPVQARDLVSRALDAAQAHLARNGFRELSGRPRGRLRQGASTTISLDLRAGVPVVMAGACDARCSDFDFQLYDAYGKLVDEDVATDDTPVLQVTPPRAGAHRLVVRMHACAASACEYGVLVTSR